MSNLLHVIAKGLVFPLVFALSLAGYQPQQVLMPQMAAQEAQYLQNSQQTPLYGATQPIAGQTYNLAGSGVSSSATSITLTGLTIKQTGQHLRTADLGDIFYVTLEPGSNTKQEIVGCTGVTNGETTDTLTGCTRGLSPIYPYTASTTLQFSHAGGSQAIFSNPPQLFNQYAALTNTQTITGPWTFSTTPTIVNAPAKPTDAVNYSTLLSTAIQGAGTSTEANMGISQLATTAQIGTASSTKGAPLVLGSRLATSTCSLAVIGILAASSTTGKLDPSCFDQTMSYSLTATTSISAASTVTNPLNLNGNAYAFPSSQQIGVLTNNGTGVLSWSAPPHYTAATSTTFLANNSTATSSTLLSIPPGILGASSTISFMGQGALIAQSSCTISVRNSLGNTLSSIGMSVPPASVNTNFSFEGLIWGNSSVSSQQGYIKYTSLNSGNANTSAINSWIGSAVTSSAINWNTSTTTLTIVLTETGSHPCSVYSAVVTVNP